MFYLLPQNCTSIHLPFTNQSHNSIIVHLNTAVTWPDISPLLLPLVIEQYMNATTMQSLTVQTPSTHCNKTCSPYIPALHQCTRNECAHTSWHCSTPCQQLRAVFPLQTATYWLSTPIFGTNQQQYPILKTLPTLHLTSPHPFLTVVTDTEHGSEHIEFHNNDSCCQWWKQFAVKRVANGDHNASISHTLCRELYAFWSLPKKKDGYKNQCQLSMAKVKFYSTHTPIFWEVVPRGGRARIIVKRNPSTTTLNH